MKTLFSFILLLIICFNSAAQESKFSIIKDITFTKSRLILVDFTDKIVTFNAFKYSKNLSHQLNRFNLTLSTTETMKDGFVVFSPKHLKRNFFKDYTINYKRSELKRLLPQVPDFRSFYPCVTY
jgi:hypothetical protein